MEPGPGMGGRLAAVWPEFAQKAVLAATIQTILALQPLAKPSDQPTEMRVQIMDSRTHRPLKGRRLIISFTDMNGQWLAKPPTIKGRTGSDGVLILKVNPPVPPRMAVFVRWAYPCSSQEDFSTR